MRSVIRPIVSSYLCRVGEQHQLRYSERWWGLAPARKYSAWTRRQLGRQNECKPTVQVMYICYKRTSPQRSSVWSTRRSGVSPARRPCQPSTRVMPSAPAPWQGPGLRDPGKCRYASNCKDMRNTSRRSGAWTLKQHTRSHPDPQLQHRTRPRCQYGTSSHVILPPDHHHHDCSVPTAP